MELGLRRSPFNSLSSPRADSLHGAGLFSSRHDSFSPSNALDGRTSSSYYTAYT
jgi:hypothetical protein